MAIINGTPNEDTLNGTPNADTINGLSGSDELRGFGGNDILIGGTELDTMIGGTGNDTYYLDSQFEQVVELGRQGTDEVHIADIYTLGANVENLVGSVFGTGNALNNRMIGSAAGNRFDGLGGNDTLQGMDGNDTLNGGVGNDLMEGGLGADIYYVDSVGDRVVELGRQGTDEVRTTLNTYSLGANVENLTYVGLGNFNGTGTALANIILGGNGTNILTGGGGNDTLRGGNAIDTAIFAGKSTDYTIVTTDGVTTVADNNAILGGNDGRDTLRGIEQLQFSDRTITLNAPAPVLNLDALNGSTGFRMDGFLEFGGAGRSVSSTGDINGDGYDDVIVGAPFPGTTPGLSFVVFGKAGGWDPVLPLSTLGGASGFRIVGETAGDFIGDAVSSAGDVNGDGLSDLLVGARGFDDNGNELSGAAYVIFGKQSGWGAEFDLTDINGANGFRLNGETAEDFVGGAVASAGDVNGDGFADVIISGVYENTGEGRSYVVFGKATGWSDEIDLSSLNGTNGFQINAEETDDAAGAAVSSAGDVNGDGFDDIFIGAPGTNDVEAGGSYVIFGKASGWSANLDLSSLNGANGFELIGRQIYDQSGFTVSSAGDINGDGFDDMIIGNGLSVYAPIEGGISYVVFGKASGWSADLDLGTLNGTNGFRIDQGPPFQLRGIVAGAGDVNGDGLDDFLVAFGSGTGNYGADNYLIYGRESGWDADLDLSTINGTNGFRLEGGATSTGSSLDSAGDVNGDGFDDLILGAPNADANGVNGSGGSYVVFGGNFNSAVTHLGTNGNDNIAGTIANETFVGALGNDVFTTNGGLDNFQGGAGNDIVRLTTANFSNIDGGHGTDTIALAGAGLTLNLTTIRPADIHSIERISLTGTGNNTLRLSVSDVLDLSDESNTLLVGGNAGDRVFRGTGWTEATTGGNNGDGTSTIAGQVYQHYSAGAASLLVDTDIDTLIS